MGRKPDKKIKVCIRRMKNPAKAAKIVKKKVKDGGKG